MPGLGEYRWLNRYIGIPYAPHGRDETGVDCYGLLCLVFRERFDMILPDWQVDVIDLRHRAGTIAAAVCSGDWTEKPDPDDGDIVVCYRGKLGYHVGVMFGGGILHALDGSGVVFEPLSRFVQQYPRIEFGEWRP